jgi:hypothetical protein
MSVLKYLQNAELTFEVPVGTFERNSVGDEVEQTRQETIKASLSPATASSVLKNDAGTETPQIMLTGFAFSALPTGGLMQTKCKIRLFDESKHVYQIGDFLITSLIKSRVRRAAKFIGIEIEGYLIETFEFAQPLKLDFSNAVNSMYVPLI